MTYLYPSIFNIFYSEYERKAIIKQGYANTCIIHNTLMYIGNIQIINDSLHCDDYKYSSAREQLFPNSAEPLPIDCSDNARIQTAYICSKCTEVDLSWKKSRNNTTDQNKYQILLQLPVKQ